MQGSYSVAGASVIGRLHVSNKVSRDDAFSVRTKGAWIIAAVADGVGSKEKSRYGAAFAVNRISCNLFECLSNIRASASTLIQTNEITKMAECPYSISTDGINLSISNGELAKDLIVEALAKTRRDLTKFAKQQGWSLKEISCTLLVLVVNLESAEVWVAQIGDGLILGLTNENEAKPLVDCDFPNEDEPTSATFVITQDNWYQHLKIAGIKPKEIAKLKTIYLMTDGVADDCQYPPPENILQLWANQMDKRIRDFSSPTEAANWLCDHYLACAPRGNFDDRTLVILYRNQEEVNGNSQPL